MITLAFLNSFTSPDMLIILVIGLLLFGRKLPDVGRSLGRGIVEFKKGLKGIDDDIETSSSRPSSAKAELTEQPSYRAPLSGGQDVRVSRNDAGEPVVERVGTAQDSQAPQH